MKFSIIAALAGSVLSVNLNKEYFYARQNGRPGYPGMTDPANYERIPTTRFSGPNDDRFLWSMITKYSAEEKADELRDGIKDVPVPSGKFWLDKPSCILAANEVLANHKGIKGAALKTYMDTYFARTWDHFDVNGTGFVEVMRIPSLMRFLASDQYMALD
tara:strand:- start:238 stop:717 length:480 start_codon:yes stop_codon:yes gene_type:complete